MSFKLGDDFIREFTKQWNHRIRTMRWIGFGLGAILMIFGGFCLARPWMISELTAIILAVVVVCFGVYRLVEYFTTPVLFRFGGKLVSGIFNLIVGYLLLTLPGDTMSTLFTTVLAIDLFLVGIEELVYAGKLRYFGAKDFAWVIINGVMNLIASCIFIFLPGMSSVALGIFIGIFMIFAGASLLIECINVREYELRAPKSSRSRSDKARRKLADSEEAEIKK